MVVTAAAKAQGGESPQEKMQKAGVLMKEAFDAVTDENKQMAKRIAELEAQVMQYKVQITSLMSQLERQKEPKVIEVEKYPEDAIYKAISHRTITDYACGLSSKYPAPPPLVISTMLSKLAVRGLLPNEDMQVINEDIIKIDNSMDKETATIINNHFAADSKCQNFNGDVKDSKFMTYDGKEGNQ
jgi:hypothetical protein